LAKVRKFKTFINPEGILEQHYFGLQTPESILGALAELEDYSKKIIDQARPILILADTSQLPKVDISPRMLKVRVAGVKTMRQINFKRAAVYGPLKVQIMVNTMALITGKQHRLRVFGDRVKAIRWLKQGDN